METYSTAQCGSVKVLARIEGMHTFFSNKWLYLCNAAKGMREVQPTTFVRECSTQFERYSLDKLLYMLTDLRVSEGPIEALNLSIITSQITL